MPARSLEPRPDRDRRDLGLPPDRPPDAGLEPASHCPHLRLCTSGLAYPVPGSCLLGQPPGYMLPSIEEFRGHCTTLRFADCPSFQARPAD